MSEIETLIDLIETIDDKLREARELLEYTQQIIKKLDDLKGRSENG